ncbi:MAG TPA: glycosyltransferase [Rhodoblastus sp.]|nr:glycosyltransferase [Rhodoblastus sp.]
MSLSKLGAIISRVPGLFLTFVLERSLFLRAGVLQRAANALLARRRAEVAPAFEVDFYLAQIGHPGRRARAARAPLLHYLLIGWREQRSPAPAFDAVYVRRRLGTPFWRDAYADWLRTVPRGPRSEFEEAHPDARTPGADGPIVLVFNHQRGGGSTRFLGLYESALMARGLWPVRLRRLTGRRTILVGALPGGRNVAAEVSDGVAPLAAQTGGFAVDHILVNHTVDHPDGLIEWIPELARDFGAPYDAFLHDYYAVCPRINLIDDQNRFCGIAPIERCRICVASAGSDAKDADIGLWRERHVRFLAGARRVLIPSDDARLRLEPLIGRALDVMEPEDEARPPPPPARPRSGPPRIVSIGALSQAKGAAVLETLARTNAALQSPVSLALIGPAVNAARLRRAGVDVTGVYLEDDLDALIRARAPDAFFFPAIWPETWSFTLTRALATGLPAVVFDIGAPAERLRRLGRADWILPLEMAGRPEATIEALARIARR